MMESKVAPKLRADGVGARLFADGDSWLGLQHSCEVELGCDDENLSL